MLELNKVFLTGHLTKDPELRYIPSGTEVCDFRIAVGKTSYDKGTNERKQEVFFINVTAWGQQAKFVNDYFKKGKGIFVEGRLKLDTWVDKNDGTSRERFSVVSERASFVESKTSDPGSRGGPEEGESRRSSARSESASMEPQTSTSAPSSEAHDDLPF